LVEPGIIIAILVLNAVVGVWQDLSARSSLESLEKMQPRLATVLRHHSDTSSSEWIVDYDATKLVPGDVIKLKVGGIVPADARLGLLTSATMYVDESSLTGESVSVGKLSGDEGLVDIIQNSNSNNDGEEGRNENLSIPIQLQTMMLFSGSLITRGSGVGVIVRSGPKTQMGLIQSTLAEAQIEGEERKTPLGVQLDEFGRKLSYIIGGICLAVWVASIPRFSDSAFNSWFEGSIYYAKVGVALGVAAIPEGLPAVITLCLSSGTRKMAEKNVIVRKLPSVETLGCTSVIATDKTGTLTTNQMTAVSFILLEEESGGINVVEHNVNGSSYSPAGYVEGIDRDETLRLPNGAVSEACRIMILCNDARLIGDDELYQYKIEGEPTEASLLALSEKLGPDAAANQPSGEEVSLKPSQLASLNCRHVSRGWDRYATLDFDRKRKSMSVLCSRLDTDSEEDKLFVKGAPNLLLERCTHVKTRDGNIVSLTLHLRDEIDSTIDSIGNKALRCIGLALSTPPKTLHREGGTYAEILKDSSQYESIETGLTFVGMVAIRDPPRDGVKESIHQCKQAGVRVIMITGDAKQTAEAIAKEVNILTDEDVASSSTRAFEGREFFALPESQQLETLRSGNLVICRAEPKHKQQLVKMLQSLQEIPAMTGDGVNDAPALQQASIGVAMGISGTDVAKEASDMVLVDDNFSTIVDAIKQGRAIYANMQAFINFLITCNIGEVIGVFLATLLGFPQLLTPLHLLWVNLVTDGPPATALGFNPPGELLLDIRVNFCTSCPIRCIYKTRLLFSIDPGLMNRKPRSSSEEIMTSENLLRYSIAGEETA
jgi:Ca2+-transporting ATPase